MFLPEGPGLGSPNSGCSTGSLLLAGCSCTRRGGLLSRHDGVQAPCSLDTLELALTASFEAEPGTFHEVSDGLRGENLAPTSRSHDPRSYGHCNSAHLGTDLLYLTDMEAGTDLKAQRLHALDRLQRALGGRGWGIEDGKEPVARGVHLATAVALQRSPDQLVVLLNELTPAAIAQLGGHLGRADDVREEDGRKEALSLAPWHRPILTKGSSPYKSLAVMQDSVGRS